MHNERICEWAAWGRSEHALKLDDRPSLLAHLTEQLGPLDEPCPPVSAARVEVPPCRLTDDDRQVLVDLVGPDRADHTASARVLHSVGKSYRDMLSARRGELSHVTDVVVYPRSEEDVVGVLAVAGERDLAVVPFGGGTSVVGGVEPRMGRHRGVVTLDLMDLDNVRLDETSHLAEIGAGAFGPQIEQALAARGYTLGHFPQSFEFSTFGGWLATRSAGQLSTRYGKIEEMVRAVRLATPRGMIATRRVPASATGPSVLQQIVGSEGVLGVITSGTAHVRPLPETVRFQGYFLPDWPDAIGFVRDLLQAGVTPSVVRLSNPSETRWLLKSSAGDAGLVQRIGKAVIQRTIRARGFEADRLCLCLLSFEGPPQRVRLACEEATHAARRCRAIRLGGSPGRSWQRDRFTLPYLRDELMARGVMVDTLETATTWSDLERLDDAVHESIGAAMSAGGTRGAMMAHVSHVYPTGASLYYTFLARQQADDPLGQWQAIKTAATRAIVDHGGTLSHHHGIGYEHQPLSAEHGPLAVDALRAVKATVDPDALMNPEKLL